jgi:hypothetical protein
VSTTRLNIREGDAWELLGASDPDALRAPNIQVYRAELKLGPTGGGPQTIVSASSFFVRARIGADRLYQLARWKTEKTVLEFQVTRTEGEPFHFSAWIEEFRQGELIPD